MYIMRNIILLIACLCISMATTAQVSEGMKYYNNGDYANALKCLKMAADNGLEIAKKALKNF